MEEQPEREQSPERERPPTVVRVQDCAVRCWLHPDVRDAHLVLATDKDMDSGTLAKDYNVGLYLRAVWKAVPGVGVGGGVGAGGWCGDGARQ